MKWQFSYVVKQMAMKNFRLLIVGKFEKPHFLKDLRHYPCEWVQMVKNAWVVGVLLREWLSSFERKQACQNKNGLLIPDEYSAHSDSDVKLKHVRISYFLPYTISNMQPLDQGTMCFMKCISEMPCALFYYEKSTNVPVADIRKWNIEDALCSVTVL